MEIAAIKGKKKNMEATGKTLSGGCVGIKRE